MKFLPAYTTRSPEEELTTEFHGAEVTESVELTKGDEDVPAGGDVAGVVSLG